MGEKRAARAAWAAGVLCALVALAAFPHEGNAACGSVTCFIVIGSQQQIPQKGLLTVNMFYTFTPMSLQGGTSGVIPAIDQNQRRLILDHHRETRTITQTATLDLNYGVTERFGFEVTVPFLSRIHHHIDGLGETNGGAGDNVDFYDNGLGDMRLTAKYNLLPTLRSMLVAGFGVELPTGKWNSRDASGGVMEAPSQLGRGQVGLIGSLYQTYELIPHRLNQFSFASYRHTFRNNAGYQFGDEYLLNGGVNIVTVPWLVLTAQVNYRYLVHDNISASLERSQTPSDPGFPGDPIVLDAAIRNRRVPNTGSTYLAFTPGFMITASEKTQIYFYSQIPVVRDFNNNLAQDVSFTFGLTYYFQVPGVS
ncbi:transporter [Nitrospira sp. Kam-Ns4a]